MRTNLSILCSVMECPRALVASTLAAATCLPKSCGLLIAGVLVSAAAASAQTHLAVVHSWGAPEAPSPSSTLIQASDGNFYRTAYDGGTSSSGTTFKMTPSGGRMGQQHRYADQRAALSSVGFHLHSGGAA